MAQPILSQTAEILAISKADVNFVIITYKTSTNPILSGTFALPLSVYSGVKARWTIGNMITIDYTIQGVQEMDLSVRAS